jgi:hypothetical protein
MYGALGGLVLILVSLLTPLLKGQRFGFWDVASVMAYAGPISGIYGALCGAAVGALYGLILSLFPAPRRLAIANALSSRIALSVMSGLLVLFVIESLIDRAVIWSSPLDFNLFSYEGAVIGVLISYLAYPRAARKLFPA